MPQRPRKFQRTSKACDFCHRRSIKCTKLRGLLERCQNCADFDIPCTYERPSRRRGGNRRAPEERHEPRSRPIGEVGVATTPSRPVHSADALQSGVNPRLSTAVYNSWATAGQEYSSDPLLNPWKALAITCQSVVLDLAQVYFEIVYPIFPLFHRPSFLRALHNKMHLEDQGLFASTMAMCSLASARARDGALYSNRRSPSQLSHPPPEVFWTAAAESIPRNLAAARGIEYMRACAILSITAIQNGQIRDMHQYLGHYHTLSIMEGLHDEKSWPNDLSTVEVEIRRRLFWSMYTLDVYSATVWGGMVRFKEIQSNVRYPREINDDLLDFENKSQISADCTTPTSNTYEHSVWMRGWNFTTDLYRILEHAIDGQRQTLRGENESPWSLFRPSPVPGHLIMEHVHSMFSALPSQLRLTGPVTGDPENDIVGFQSANIQATLQLLNMVLSSNEVQGIEEKCEVAGNVLSVFTKVPIEYLKAISSPLLYHLGGIGFILGSVMEGSLSEASYQRVRKLLLDMAALLYQMESALTRSTGASERLKTQVKRIDEYMDKARHASMHSGLAEIGQSQHFEGYVQPTAVQSADFDDPLACFELPSDLLDDWPWSSGAGSLGGMFPMALAKTDN
ncbi:Zn(II)2Cys6 transcription factor [Aspergillus novoparasiticus]|uniref:Zn(II)2Cys6 transcription factor n=1 Tax=Aspergillus novoparasiticus TaxID=986946 RepID=A0A5N6F070_9EURO|nr:Zn(II)2Cys6 transcription factor [Aspergillus novoparasiticus]